MSCLLSVIIPVYNAEKFLPVCLDSIIAAQVDGIEILLVDDGSKDKSHEICLLYQEKHSFIKLLSQKNSGPSAARNRGLEHAKGEYIAFIDSDDYINPQSFCHHIEFIRQYSADIWVSDFERVADNGCVLDRVYQIRDSHKPIADNEYLQDFLSAKDCVWNVWRYLFRREFIEKKALRFAEGYHCAEDLEFVVRALGAAESFVFFHEPYYSYRVNYGASLTRTYTTSRVQQLMTMLQKAAEALCNSEAEKLLKAKLAREYILNLSLLYEVTRPERQVVLQELKKAKWLMSEAKGIYALAAKAVNVCGISVSAYLLYMMKRFKRYLRSMKMRYHGG